MTKDEILSIALRFGIWAFGILSSFGIILHDAETFTGKNLKTQRR